MSTIEQERGIREKIMNLLSDDEIALVSNAETPAAIATGDEYIDLEQIHRGVRRADGASTPVTRALPRKCVHAETWTKILAQLAAPHS